MRGLLLAGATHVTRHAFRLSSLAKLLGSAKPERRVAAFKAPAAQGASSASMQRRKLEQILGANGTTSSGGARNPWPDPSGLASAQ